MTNDPPIRMAGEAEFEGSEYEPTRLARMLAGPNGDPKAIDFEIVNLLDAVLKEARVDDKLHDKVATAVKSYVEKFDERIEVSAQPPTPFPDKFGRWSLYVNVSAPPRPDVLTLEVHLKKYMDPETGEPLSIRESEKPTNAAPHDKRLAIWKRHVDCTEMDRFAFSLGKGVEEPVPVKLARVGFDVCRVDTVVVPGGLDGEVAAVLVIPDRAPLSFLGTYPIHEVFAVPLEPDERAKWREFLVDLEPHTAAERVLQSSGRSARRRNA